MAIKTLSPCKEGYDQYAAVIIIFLPVYKSSVTIEKKRILEWPHVYDILPPCDFRLVTMTTARMMP